MHFDQNRGRCCNSPAFSLRCRSKTKERQRRSRFAFTRYILSRIPELPAPRLLVSFPSYCNLVLPAGTRFGQQNAANCGFSEIFLLAKEYMKGAYLFPGKTWLAHYVFFLCIVKGATLRALTLFFLLFPGVNRNRLIRCDDVLQPGASAKLVRGIGECFLLFKYCPVSRLRNSSCHPVEMGPSAPGKTQETRPVGNYSPEACRLELRTYILTTYAVTQRDRNVPIYLPHGATRVPECGIPVHIGRQIGFSGLGLYVNILD